MPGNFTSPDADPFAPSSASSLVWFRRDLRDVDNAALAAALADGAPVYCAFVFDMTILDALPSRADRRLAFIHASVLELDAALRARGGGLLVRHGDPCELIPQLAAELHAGCVYANRDYEPYAKARDATVAAALAEQGRRFLDFRDQVIFDCSADAGRQALFRLHTLSQYLAEATGRGRSVGF